MRASFGKPRFNPREDFSDPDSVRVFYWAVLHDRTVTWALQHRHGPPPLRRGLVLPADTTMSRRLASPSVRLRLTRLEERIVRPTGTGLYWMIDGKPLPIGGGSKDRQAGYGRAAGGKAKGYKLHALVAPDGAVAAVRTHRRVHRWVQANLGTVSAKALPPNWGGRCVGVVCVCRGAMQPIQRPRHKGLGKSAGVAPLAECKPYGPLGHPAVRQSPKLVLTALQRRLPVRTCAA